MPEYLNVGGYSDEELLFLSENPVILLLNYSHKENRYVFMSFIPYLLHGAESFLRS